jgi:hypothetical protein
MINSNVKMYKAVFILFTFAICSCTTVRINQGFSYKPAIEGPSIGSQTIAETQTNETKIETNFESIPELQLNHQEVDLQNLIESNKEVFVESENPIEIRKSFQDIVNQYAVENKKTITKNQLKRLNKIAEIIEHKARFSSIDWAPETNVELFFLMGAGLGLLVGLLTIGLGWFIFIVFSLLYLYFKLIA